MASTSEQYAALTTGAGLVDFGDRTQLEITGADRAKFLHNLCTNAVVNLIPGTGCEAFVLNVKGHIVGHVSIFAGPNSHIVETVPGQAEKLLTHFDRYRIREDVQFQDRCADWFELLLSGSRAADILSERTTDRQWTIPRERLSHTIATMAGVPVWLRKVDWAFPDGFLVAGPRESFAEIQRMLIESNVMPCEADALEAARIEQGTPWFGRDITDQNLPQEIDRDRLAISFTKGCYLGQETVARIDALGHVNRLLRGIRFDGKVLPRPGLELHAGAEQKPAGHVTSVCWSPRLKAPLALAFVSPGHHEPGSRLQSEIGPAEVVKLPLGSN